MRAQFMLFGTLICHHIWLIVLNVYKKGLLNVTTQVKVTASY